jgi:tetratricopeptide (TPR) repeat protein
MSRMREWVGFLAVLLLLSSSASADDARKAKALYENGIRLYNVGEYRQALEAFKDAYLAKPDPVLLFNMGQSQRQLGDDEGAIRSFRAFLRELPDAPNREQVERLLAASEHSLEARQARPPTPLKAEAPPLRHDLTPSPEPLVAQVEHPAPSAPPVRTHRPRWVWAVVGVAAAVVVAGASVGIAYAVPHDAAARSGTDSNVTLTFH